jgi:phosphoribosyl 1,2-cyclic phosphodiesterase
MGFSLKFWGVRGSIACPSPHHVYFGGNTACLEITVAGRKIVLDAGTGIRTLGTVFAKEGVGEAQLLLTHTHWDHINGFPFFSPAFDSSHRLFVKAGHVRHSGGIRNALAGQMMQPFFPVPLEAMHAGLDFEDFDAGDSFDLDGDVHVRTAPLNHPNGATGYRLEHGGKSLCYITDTEHVIGKPDRNVLGLIEGADLVVYDSTYTDEEFPSRIGWGHSTWQEGLRLCREARAKRLAIFHHEPNHEDDFMMGIQAQAREEWDGAFVAREGTSITLL